MARTVKRSAQMSVKRSFQNAFIATNDNIWARMDAEYGPVTHADPPPTNKHRPIKPLLTPGHCLRGRYEYLYTRDVCARSNKSLRPGSMVAARGLGSGCLCSAAVSHLFSTRFAGGVSDRVNVLARVTRGWGYMY